MQIALIKINGKDVPILLEDVKSIDNCKYRNIISGCCGSAVCSSGFGVDGIVRYEECFVCNKRKDNQYES